MNAIVDPVLLQHLLQLLVLVRPPSLPLACKYMFTNTDYELSEQFYLNKEITYQHR